MCRCVLRCVWLKNGKQTNEANHKGSHATEPALIGIREISIYILVVLAEERIN